MRRSDVTGTIGFCASLVFHGAAGLVLINVYAGEISSSDHRGSAFIVPATPQRDDGQVVVFPDRSDKPQPADANPDLNLKWPMPAVAVLPPVVPPALAPTRDSEFGEHDGKGEAANSSAGAQPQIAREGSQEQAYLSKDPVGPGPLPDEPSRFTGVPGEGGRGGQRAGAAGSVAQLRVAEPAAPRVPFGVAAADVRPRVNAKPPEPTQKPADTPDPRNLKPRQGVEGAPPTDAVAKGPELPLPAGKVPDGKVPDAIEKHGKVPDAKLPDVKSPGNNPDPRAPEAKPTNVKAVEVKAPDPKAAPVEATPRVAAIKTGPAEHAGENQSARPAAGTAGPNAPSAVAPAAIDPVKVAAIGAAQALPPTPTRVRPVETAVAVQAGAKPPESGQGGATAAVSVAIPAVPANPEPKPTPDAISPATRPASPMAMASPAGGEGGREGKPGPKVAAADPAPQAETESDPFSAKSLKTIEFRPGGVQARLGRAYKISKPRLPIKGQLDLTSISDPSVVVKVTIDSTGKVTDATVIKSSGSNEIDLPTTMALYKAWFEAPKDSHGNATGDVILFRIVWH